MSPPVIGPPVMDTAAKHPSRARSAARGNGRAGRPRRGAAKYWRATVAGWACALALAALAGCEEAAPGDGAPGDGERAPQRQAGERFRDCSACPELVVVPAGSF
ncbi:MAG: hypothetical protein OXJ62_10560, partial [Spirochaetaceae bacterium]|nr:hypothetical protein [Spirochaetaceae bacterium]